MATAELGVAMGAQGSDVAPETADAVVVRDELAMLTKGSGCPAAHIGWWVCCTIT